MANLPIKETKDYRVFKYVKGNRQLNSQHVKKLAKSMKEYNFMPWQPVLVSQEGYVIDGQHRIAAAKALHIPVQYVTVPFFTLPMIQKINSNMKIWSLQQFTDSYIALGNQSYKLLDDFKTKHSLPLSQTANLLSGVGITTGGGSSERSIRDGTFQVKDGMLEKAEKFMERLSEIAPYVDGSVWRTRTFLRALSYLYKKGMKHDLLVKHLQLKGEKLHKMMDWKDYLFALQNVYNLKMRKNRLDILQS